MAGSGFRGRQFTAEVILWAVRWYLMFPVSYRDLELMLMDRGVEVDHTTIFRWIQAYAAELEKRIRPHLRTSNGPWRGSFSARASKCSWVDVERDVLRRFSARSTPLPCGEGGGACGSRQRLADWFGNGTGESCATRRRLGKIGQPIVGT